MRFSKIVLSVALLACNCVMLSFDWWMMCGSFDIMVSGTDVVMISWWFFSVVVVPLNVWRSLVIFVYALCVVSRVIV